MESFHLWLRVPRSLLSTCLSVDHCICFYVLQEDASLMMAERDTEDNGMSLGVVLLVQILEQWYFLSP